LALGARAAIAGSGDHPRVRQNNGLPERLDPRRRLRKLNQEGECHYLRGADKGDRFTADIIRLWDLGLVSKKVSSFWDMDLEGDLKKYAEKNDRGRLYLKLRDEYQGLKSN
jgi:hypothetical protein